MTQWVKRMEGDAAGGGVTQRGRRGDGDEVRRRRR